MVGRLLIIIVIMLIITVALPKGHSLDGSKLHPDVKAKL